MICCEPALDLSEPALIDIMGHQIILTLPGTLSIKNNMLLWPKNRDWKNRIII
jgi:hypothetical protein